MMEESWVNHDLAQERQIRLIMNGLFEIILRQVLRKIESMCRKKKLPSNSKNIFGNRANFAISSEDIIN
jgi:hypothetical protein